MTATYVLMYICRYIEGQTFCGIAQAAWSSGIVSAYRAMGREIESHHSVWGSF
jgi:NADH:ubiquinone oxidoreductase subunit F (NADH-binding)